jgi:hypothetical protein
MAEVQQGKRCATGASLLGLALAAERDLRHWRTEFAWLLAHPAVVALDDAPGGERSPDLGAMVGQQATRFPIVSGDVEWLRQRSMAVLARRMAPHLAAGHHIGLDVSTVARSEAAALTRREQMRALAAGLREALPAALERYGVAVRRLTLSVAADHPGVGSVLDLRACATLGHPRVCVRLPERMMQSLAGAAEAADPAWPGDPRRLWLALTALAHAEPAVGLVLGQTTRPACALAWGEHADAVLPLGQFEVRADTAWLVLGLRLDRLAVPGAVEGWRELRRLLRAALRFADNLVEQVAWVSSDLAQDALVNRRLALHVTGIGDLIDRWRLAPTTLPALDLAVRSLALLHRLLLRESNALARERGPFPGLELRDLEGTLTRNFGAERARRLLRQAGLRHRHLLVLSPCSVLPLHAARHPLPAYLHLLPAIRAADTIALQGLAQARALPLGAFRQLVRMSWAIARNRP